MNQMLYLGGPKIKYAEIRSRGFWWATLSQTLSEALKTLWAGSCKLQTPNLSWKVLELKKIKKVHLCICFQLGNSFGNTKMERKSTYVFVFN